MKGMGKFGSGLLGTTLKPFNAFLGALGETEFAVEFGNAETVHGTRVEGSRGFAEELEGLGRLSAAAPSVFAAGSSAICSVGMAVLGGEDEEGVGAVKVLLALDRPDAVGVAVSEEILACRVASVCQPLEERCGLANEILALLEGLFDLKEVTRSVWRNGEGFGGVNHEDGKLELKIGVLGLFCVGAVEFEGAFMGKEGGLLASAEMGVVEDGAIWGRRGCADGVCGG
jgi:hypothetical protein